MDAGNRRKFERYDAFIQLNLFVPISLGEKAFELTGWIKNVSRDGIALEIYFFSADEIESLSKLAAGKQQITASILFPDDSPINAECKVVWGKLIKDKKLFVMGLHILAINPLQKDKWDSFIEKLSRLSYS